MLREALAWLGGAAITAAIWQAPYVSTTGRGGWWLAAEVALAAACVAGVARRKEAGR